VVDDWRGPLREVGGKEQQRPTGGADHFTENRVMQPHQPLSALCAKTPGHAKTLVNCDAGKNTLALVMIQVWVV